MNQNNGLITKIWGPYVWIALHFITFGYPINPTDKQKRKYKKFFKLIKYVLPCRFCRESYTYFINNVNKLTNDVLLNRNSFVEWLYKIHNCVNIKLNKECKLTIDDIKNKYEDCRVKYKKKKNNQKKNINYKKIKYEYYLNLCNIPFYISKLYYEYILENQINLPRDIYQYYNFTNNINKNNFNLETIKMIEEYRIYICDKINNFMHNNNIHIISENKKKISKYELILIMNGNSHLKKDLLLDFFIKK